MCKIYNQKKMVRSCVVAGNRKFRPIVGAEKNKCPFCLGNEEMLETVWIEAMTTEEDKIKVVNNKYPICDIHSEVYGIHDVVIDTLNHELTPKDFSIEHWEVLLAVIKKRWQELKADSKISFIQVFKNCGKKAGSSIAHSHWQIVALQQTPITVLAEYAKSNDECIICDLMKTIESENVIIDTKDWMIIAPNMPNMCYETWIIPKRHITNYEEMNDCLISELSKVLSNLLIAYNTMMRDIEYNICFMSGRPNETSNYHFYIKIIPREGNFGGFELATGCSITMVDAKQYASSLATLLHEMTT